MKVHEIINEAEPSDIEFKQRYGEFDPEDKPMLPYNQLSNEPASTLWSAYDVVRDILGTHRVTADDEQLKPGMYYVYQSSEPPMFRDTDDGVGSINLPNLESTSARDVAVAAHEAYHAYVHNKVQGGEIYGNEKVINNLAEKWLRKHLSGSALHVALEKIVGSRINYGPHHLPKSAPQHRANGNVDENLTSVGAKYQDLYTQYYKRAHLAARKKGLDSSAADAFASQALDRYKEKVRTGEWDPITRTKPGRADYTQT